MIYGYLKNNWELLEEDVKDTFSHGNGRVQITTRLYQEWLCKDWLKQEIICLKALLVANDNISCIMIEKVALAKYSQVEMLLGALPGHLRAKAVMKLELDPRNPLTFSYNKLRKSVHNKYWFINANAFINVEGACTAPVVCLSLLPAGVLLHQMPVVVNLVANSNKVTPVPVHATEAIAFTKAESIINVNMDIMTNAFKAKI